MAVHVISPYLRRSMESSRALMNRVYVHLTYGGSPYKVYIYSGKSCIAMLKDPFYGRSHRVYANDFREEAEIAVPRVQNYSTDVYATMVTSSGLPYKLFLYNMLKDKTSYFVLQGSFTPGKDVTINRY